MNSTAGAKKLLPEEFLRVTLHLHRNVQLQTVLIENNMKKIKMLLNSFIVDNFNLLLLLSLYWIINVPVNRFKRLTSRQVTDNALRLTRACGLNLAYDFKVIVFMVLSNKSRRHRISLECIVISHYLHSSGQYFCIFLQMVSDLWMKYSAISLIQIHCIQLLHWWLVV